MEHVVHDHRQLLGVSPVQPAELIGSVLYRVLGDTTQRLLLFTADNCLNHPLLSRVSDQPAAWAEPGRAPILGQVNK